MKSALDFLLFLCLHLMKNPTDGGKRNRTDIRTGGESEKNQNHLAFELIERQFSLRRLKIKVRRFLRKRKKGS